MEKDSCCSYCGAHYTKLVWPRQCDSCLKMVWRNPLPVVVVLVDTLDDNERNPGLVLVKRAIPPKLGEWAFPGGFLEVGETWQAGARRELREETGIDLPLMNDNEVKLLDVVTAPTNGNLLIFCKISIWQSAVPSSISNNEVSEIMVAHSAMELAFPTHTEFMKKFFIIEGAISEFNQVAMKYFPFNGDV